MFQCLNGTPQNNYENAFRMCIKRLKLCITYQGGYFEEIELKVFDFQFLFLFTDPKVKHKRTTLVNKSKDFAIVKKVILLCISIVRILTVI